MNQTIQTVRCICPECWKGADVSADCELWACGKCGRISSRNATVGDFDQLWSRIEQEYTAVGVTENDYNRAAVKDGARAMYHLLTRNKFAHE